MHESVGHEVLVALEWIRLDLVFADRLLGTAAEGPTVAGILDGACRRLDVVIRRVVAGDPEMAPPPEHDHGAIRFGFHSR
jgi:hypothetical protein